MHTVGVRAGLPRVRLPRVRALGQLGAGHGAASRGGAAGGVQRHSREGDDARPLCVEPHVLRVALHRDHLDAWHGAGAWHVHGMCMARAWRLHGMGMARAMVSIISLDAWHGGEGTGARSVVIEVAGREALRTKRERVRRRGEGAGGGRGVLTWYAASMSGMRGRATACAMRAHCAAVGSTPVGLCAHACSSTTEPAGSACSAASIPSKSRPPVRAS
eukprot:scaffold109995_cov60-Phaeocystis_antarctica.AAC.1